MEANILNWEAAGPAVSTTATSTVGVLILFFFFGIFVAICVAQGFICAKVKHPLAGLIIPAISFVFGALVALIIATIPAALRVMAIMQIPTVIYFAIFMIMRLYLQKGFTPTANKKEIDKMNIQDL